MLHNSFLRPSDLIQLDFRTKSHYKIVKTYRFSELRAIAPCFTKTYLFCHIIFLGPFVQYLHSLSLRLSLLETTIYHDIKDDFLCCLRQCFANALYSPNRACQRNGSGEAVGRVGSDSSLQGLVPSSSGASSQKT